MHEQTQNPISKFWRRLWGTEQKAAVDREKEGNEKEGDYGCRGSSAQGKGLGLSESVTLREITNEA